MSIEAQKQERNFCERCGKRLVDGSIHTCTPPVEEALNRKAENARELCLDNEPEQTNEQEPVAWRFENGTRWTSEVHWQYLHSLDGTEGLPGLQPLYTSPPQSQWMGLTMEDVEEIHTQWVLEGGFGNLIGNIEAKLKQKNGYSEEKNT